jgi:uncharacterized protein
MGRVAVPLRQFVLKVHSRCDLACDHCYVYYAADQSWRDRPVAMSDETIAWAAQRIAEHVKTHQLSGVQVVLHGGEPLLAGIPRLRLIVETLRSALDGLCDLDLRIHSNGVRLDDEFLKLFAEFDVKVGVSIDGYRAANDRHRRYVSGRSSYDQVVRAIGRLRAESYRHLYAGLLCTIDLSNDPVAVYESLLSLDPPRIDFLLPHATWDSPPTRPNGTETAYADWLIAIFDRWYADGMPVQVRTFDSIIMMAHGGNSLTEALGLSFSDLAVIETDGTYEQADSLKVAFAGASATGYSVYSHSLDVLREHPGMSARQRGLEGLCETCRSCNVVTICGGGLYAHRYRSGAGFDNPSVYCADLMKLIGYIGQEIRQAKRGPLRYRTHAIPAAEFRELARGIGGPAAVSELVGAQRSLSRALVMAARQAAIASAGDAAAEVGMSAAWDLLVRIDQEAPDIVSDVLSHPYVRVWAVHCMTRLRGAPESESDGGIPLSTDLGHLASIAASAAIRSNTSASLIIPVRDGAIFLPTLGMLALGRTGEGARQTGTPASLPVLALVTVNAARNAVIVQTPTAEFVLNNAELMPGEVPVSSDLEVLAGTESACWRPVRRLSTPGLSITLEDTDPYRNCHQWKASTRLSSSEYVAWQRRFGAAWLEIQQHHRAYAPGLAAGLTTIMPLVQARPGREISAAARNAFGAIAIALPAEPVTLALLLIHEFQHVKLGALFDLYDLFDGADTRLFPAPWRDDLRPLEGLLQGTYAHVAVTDFWRARRNLPTSRIKERIGTASRSDTAGAQFAHWRVQTLRAIETLTSSGSLTPLGERFVTEMRESITPWLAEEVAVRLPRK